MRGTRLLMAAVLALTVGCASGTAQAPKQRPVPEDAASYYPLEPGWKWAYDVEQEGEAILATYSVVSREGDRVTVTGGEQVLDYVVKPDGITRPQESGGDYVLRAPLRQGASWPIRGGQAKVVGWNETVETPAGRFAGCVTVEELRDNPDRRALTTYAPHVGPVRMMFEAMDAGGVQTTRATLRGFTRPGQDPLAAAAP